MDIFFFIFWPKLLKLPSIKLSLEVKPRILSKILLIWYGNLQPLEAVKNFITAQWKMFVVTQPHEMLRK